MAECHACEEFVRMQKELCELLHESDEGDSMGMHARLVYAVKALRDDISLRQTALQLLRPFVEEDFPNGPDGAACVTDGYRQAYHALVAVLGPSDQPGREP